MEKLTLEIGVQVGITVAQRATIQQLLALPTIGEAAPARSDTDVLRDSAIDIVPDLGTYWPGQGGIYVGTVPAMLGTPARHLIASTEETRLAWGPAAETRATSQVDGPANTAVLCSHDEAHPMARWCRDYTADGHTDFHLPSRFDLLMAWMQSPNTFSKDGWYWSSTQLSRHHAFVQVFELGYSSWYGKGNGWRGRAFRWIHLNA